MYVLEPVYAWAVAIAIAATIAAVLGWRHLTGRRVPGYLALCEYWVYTTHGHLPEQKALMDRMISANPHNRPGNACIGAREGMLFTDIRLHIAVAKRSKNPHIFRPDLFQESVEPSAEVLSRLAEADSLIKVRYRSEVELRDMRHLQFMPHLADAMTDLSEGLIVYDVVCEQIYSAEDFRALLEKNNNAERPDMTVRVSWGVDRTDGTGYAETKGLRKLGMEEMRTDSVEADQEILIVGLLMRVAHELVRDPCKQGPFEYKEYGDTFVLEPRKVSGQMTRVAIRRRKGG